MTSESFRAGPIAENVAEAMRALALATRPGDAGLSAPSDVYDVLGALSDAVATLAQVTGQLADYLDRELQADRISLDPSSFLRAEADALAAVAATTALLEDAGRTAGDLAEALSSAHEKTSRMSRGSRP